MAGREGDLAMEEDFPEIYKQLFSISKTLVYEKKWNPQEIEFTFEKPGGIGPLYSSDPGHGLRQEGTV